MQAVRIFMRSYRLFMSIYSLNIIIGGVQGYVGRELLRLVLQHPYLHLTGILARKSQQELYQELPAIADLNIPVLTTDDMLKPNVVCDVLLLATPTESSMEWAALFNKCSFKIIDLSGAFRLSADEFNHWYAMPHTAPDLLADAQYGLSPWNNDAIKNQSLLANPGCYATCALMALIPLLKNNIIKSSDIIIDAKSGVSGAGKKAHDDLMFCEITENFFPYKIGKHQHIPEINKALAQFTDQSCNVTLITHLLPINRGISMSIYADADAQFVSEKEISVAIQAAYESGYTNYPLVKFAEINAGNAQQDKFLLSLKSVVGTSETHIAYFVQGKKIFIFATIDNLLKGAASQAIENINAMQQWPIETGL